MLRGTVALLLGDGRGGGEVGVRGTVGQIGGVGWGGGGIVWTFPG